MMPTWSLRLEKIVRINLNNRVRVKYQKFIDINIKNISLIFRSVVAKPSEQIATLILVSINLHCNQNKQKS